MRIKRLELQGFKSFKDKTAINFDAGITGIVGPNGCGKSNVVDAFFWALGEMNPRNLRGLNMEDLIFNGSSHAPASNVAEVNLILEIPAEISGPNAPAGASIADLSLAPLTREVAITRRLYRNGESEYFINKVPCRLRDIQELFMDTGAGARGYSIIQQGKIAEIVNAKPDERRTMIEDVAGIVKYKSRRREAQRKLEATNQNLLRVTDILTEIDGRRRQMERQAEKAKRYKEWREQLQTIELRHSTAQWEDIAEKLGSWDRNLADLEAQDVALSAQRQSAELKFSESRLEATSAEKVTEELQAKWIRQGQELSTAENNRNYQQKILADLAQAIEGLERESVEEAARAESLRELLVRVEQENTELEAEYLAAQEQREEAENSAQEIRLRAESQSREADAAQAQYLKISGELSKVNQRLFSAESRRRDLELRREELERTRLDEEARFTGFASERDEALARQEFAQAAVQAAETGLADLNTNLKTNREALEQARREASEKERSELKLSGSLQALEDQKRRFTGSALGVQTVFQTLLPKNSNWESGVLGTLATSLKSAPDMDVAIEVALGNSLETILAKNSAVVEGLAGGLREVAAGRATFADLSQLPKASIAAGVIPGAQALIECVEVTSTESTQEIQALLAQLLDGFYVVADFAEARRLAAQNESLSFVTRSGELCRGSWYVLGGDTKQVSGAIVARNREIDQLKQDLDVARTATVAAKAMIIELEAMQADLQSEQQRLEGEREQTRSTLAEARSALSILEAQYRQAERSLQSAAQEFDRVNNEVTQLQAQETEAREELGTLEQDSAAHLSEWETKRASVPELRQAADLAQTQLSDARVREAALSEQKNSLNAQVRNAQSNLSMVANRQSNLESQIREKTEGRERAAEEIQSLGERVEILRSEIVEAEAIYRNARDNLDQLNAELDRFRADSESTMKQERMIKDSMAQLRIGIERTQFERQNIAQNVLDRYGIEMGEYVSSPEVREQLEMLRNLGPEAQKELETEVLRLREKIRKLGEVNVSAIEEFDELTTRFNFLTEQKADLEKSMADLQSTIDKINKISRERFFRAFHEVNTQFTQVFPALFGGGMAELTLTSPDDFNETGVDIVAQPPGKKLQNINLLSGGEKTLTAISLLFAIFLVKPSPFCLLDEVDAPLDDANIGRFNALLREMSKQSQFIIITHNKRTMELNDKLYGVTMEDAGISKMVSIQLAG